METKNLIGNIVQNDFKDLYSAEQSAKAF